MRKYRVFLIGAVVAVLLLWLLTPGRGPTIQNDSTLVINLAGNYIESAEPSLLMQLLPDRPISFAALLSELKKAERDDRLSAVIFRVRSLDIGWACQATVSQHAPFPAPMMRWAGSSLQRAMPTTS